jgi:hypothetical protein
MDLLLASYVFRGLMEWELFREPLDFARTPLLFPIETLAQRCGTLQGTFWIFPYRCAAKYKIVQVQDGLVPDQGPYHVAPVGVA